MATALYFKEQHTLRPWDTTTDRRILESMDRFAGVVLNYALDQREPLPLVSSVIGDFAPPMNP